MAQQKLEELSKVLSRLEAALDRIDKKLAGGAGGGGAVGGEDKPFVIEWDKLVDTHIKPFRELSNKIGGDVAKHVELMDKCFKAERDVLRIAATSKKPDMQKFQQILQPLSQALGECKEFKEKNRASKQINHLNTIAEGISCLAWVAEALPGPFVNDMRASSEFWSNRILKEFKGKEEIHVQWVKYFNDFMKELAVYAKNYHTQGLAWAG